MRQDPYLYDRAEVELRMAERATCPEAVRVHYQLANLYLDRFYNPAATLGDDASAAMLPLSL